jgi:hypothetical protein
MSRRFSTTHPQSPTIDARRVDPPQEDWESRDFRCQRLGEALFLLTYTLQQGARLTRRASFWRRDADGWRIVFHQARWSRARDASRDATMPR